MERQERWDDEKEDVSNCWMKETRILEIERGRSKSRCWRTLTDAMDPSQGRLGNQFRTKLGIVSWKFNCQ